MIRHGRSFIAGALLFTALIFSGVRRAHAQGNGQAGASGQDRPPDLAMLLNLDLFESRPHDGAATETPGASDSMLDQIRTLDAMGYLGTNPRYAAPDGVNAAAASDMPRRPPPAGVQGQPTPGIQPEDQPTPGSQIE
jgi:hypothetical protein